MANVFLTVKMQQDLKNKITQCVHMYKRGFAHLRIPYVSNKFLKNVWHWKCLNLQGHINYKLY